MFSYHFTFTFKTNLFELVKVYPKKNWMLWPFGWSVCASIGINPRALLKVMRCYWGPRLTSGCDRSGNAVVQYHLPLVVIWSKYGVPTMKIFRPINSRFRNSIQTCFWYVLEERIERKKTRKQGQQAQKLLHEAECSRDASPQSTSYLNTSFIKKKNICPYELRNLRLINKKVLWEQVLPQVKSQTMNKEIIGHMLYSRVERIWIQQTRNSIKIIM